jgi:hypothetical protein
MTELTSNARFIQGINILTAKIQDPVALEALVKAMETCLEGEEYGSSGVDGSGLVGAEIKPKHPLEDYEVTEKDIGSLVYVWDAGDEEYPKLDKLLGYCAEAEFYPYVADSANYRYSKPYLDPIALYFIPFYATENSVAPDDLGQHFAVLWSDGRISALSETWGKLWTKDEDQPYAVGYRPLKFVNPLEEV